MARETTYESDSVWVFDSPDTSTMEFESSGIRYVQVSLCWRLSSHSSYLIKEFVFSDSDHLDDVIAAFVKARDLFKKEQNPSQDS